MKILSIQKGFTCLCLAILSLLAGMAAIQHATGKAERNFSVQRERRQPHPRPAFHDLPSSQWGKAIDTAFNDRFPCRRGWIRNYRSIFVKRLHAPYARRVPGKGRYEFYMEDIPELETYMGLNVLTEDYISDWVTIFEGRKAWCEAMGIDYLQLLIPIRAFVDEEFLPARIRMQRRISPGELIFQRTRKSKVASNIVYPFEFLLDAKKANGSSCYYRHDSHFSAQGIFVIYQLMNSLIRERHPSIQQISLSDPPLKGPSTGPECRLAGRLLSVSYPGETNILDDYYLRMRDTGYRYPEKNIMTRRPGGGLYLLLSNDSMIRLSLDSWLKEEGNVHLPFAEGVRQVRSYMWRTMGQGLLDTVVTEEIPDIWIEEMLEDRLIALHFTPDKVLRNAAAYERAEPRPGLVLSGEKGGKAHVLVILEQPRSRTTSDAPHELLPVPVRFFIGDECVHEATTYQGIRRAVFTPPIPIHPRHIGQKVRIEIDGQAESIRLSLRTSE